MSHDFFLQCLREAAANKELVAEFDRLNGSNLSFRGAPIDLCDAQVTYLRMMADRLDGIVAGIRAGVTSEGGDS